MSVSGDDGSSQTFNNTSYLMLMPLFLNNAIIHDSENFVG